MKRLSFLLVAVMLSFMTLFARTFYVEKAVNVTKGGVAVSAGQVLNEQDVVTIKRGGVIMFVDKESKNRWVVKKQCTRRIDRLVKVKRRNLVKQALSFVNSLFYKPSDQSSTPGAGVRGNILEEWDKDETFSVDYSIGLMGDSIQYYYVK